jgi:hypothetical protein
LMWKQFEAVNLVSHSLLFAVCCLEKRSWESLILLSLLLDDVSAVDRQLVTLNLTVNITWQYTRWRCSLWSTGRWIHMRFGHESTILPSSWAGKSLGIRIRAPGTQSWDGFWILIFDDKPIIFDEKNDDILWWYTKSWNFHDILVSQYIHPPFSYVKPWALTRSCWVVT